MRVGPPEVMARLLADAPVSAGTEVTFGVDMANVTIFDRETGACVN